MKSKLKVITILFVLAVFVCMYDVKESKAAGTYLIRVNKQQCVVTIYKKDKQGAYTVPVKAMLCSPGAATPLGKFDLKEKIRWHTLDGPTYGQYCSRIVEGILFHSVWYYEPDPSKLACNQYNNLGSQVSHGCIRLTVRDAKWIFENCPSGTTVDIYNSNNPGPLGKPVSIKVPGYTNWDPTDETNPNNPWNKKKPKIKGAKNKNITFSSKYKITEGLKVTNTTGYNSIKLLEIKIWFKGGGSLKYRKVKEVNTRKPGIYKINYKIVDEIGRKAQVTVKHKVLTKVSVSKIILNTSKRTLYLGGTANQKTTTLKVKRILPKKASMKGVTIKSSNSKVAKVTKKGKVIAKKAGECNIIFAATDGSRTTAICKIIVKQKAVKLSLKADSNKVYVGSSLKLKTNYTPADTSDKRTEFTSSNPTIASVNTSGVVTALKAGNVTITAKVKDGTGCRASINLTIVYKYSGVVSGPADIVLGTGDDFIQAMNRLLPKTLTIKDISGYTEEANVKWDTSEYSDGLESCTVYGTITLPTGWEGTPERYQIKVNIIL